MSEQIPSPTGEQPKADPPDQPRRRWFFVLVIALAAGLAGAVTTQALSQGDRFGFGPGAWHHGGFLDRSADPAHIEDHADRAVRHLAVEIDATSEQQEKLRAIVKEALEELLPMRETARAARQQAHDLLTQPSVDRDAIERFRAEQMALWDTASRRVAEAVAEAAEVLTPEQRGKLGEILPSGRGFWHGRHHG